MAIPQVPNEVIDATIERFLDGATIPRRKKKKKAEGPLTDKQLMAVVRSTGRSGFTTRIELAGNHWSTSLTQHELRLWVNGNWNADPPTLQGDVVLDAVRRVVERIRDRMEAEAEANSAAEALAKAEVETA